MEINEFRDDMVRQCLGIGLINLARVAAESSDPGDIVAAAELDIIEGGMAPAHAWRAVSAGAFAYQLTAFVQRIAELSFAPDVSDYQ